MHLKSISYESMISALIDACVVTEDRNEDLATKRSFTTKQSIYSHALLERLLNYLSGEDKSLKNTLDSFFEILEEAMKNMSSSPFLLEMDNGTYNDEFIRNLILPFISLHLFNIKADFSSVSPVFHFISFIERGKTTTLYSSIRDYIKIYLNYFNLPKGHDSEFRIFIGKISSGAKLRPKTIKEKIDLLDVGLEESNRLENHKAFLNLTASLHGMRLVLVFERYINDLAFNYECAKKGIKPIDSIYWEVLRGVSDSIKKTGRMVNFKDGLNHIVNISEILSVRYHEDLVDKYNIHPDEMFNDIMDCELKFDVLNELLIKNKKSSESVYYKILDAFMDVYNLDFEIMHWKLENILSECEKYPSCRLNSLISRVLIALTIKMNCSKIKNKTLESHIYKLISMDKFREKEIPKPKNAFYNNDSLFSNDAAFHTIMDSLFFWHDFIKEKLKLSVCKVPELDIEFIDKIENALDRIYFCLDKVELELYSIDDNELTSLVKSALSTDVLIENIITFIPNLTLYFSLREIYSIYYALSLRMKIKSSSLTRFLCESSASKRKLLKAINLSEYMKDVENEKKIQSVT